MANSELTLSWNDTWAFLSSAPDETMKDFWQQIGLVEFLQSKAPKYQIEIIEHAPTWVYKHVLPVLHPVTRKKLDEAFGVGKEEEVKRKLKPKSYSAFRIVIK